MNLKGHLRMPGKFSVILNKVGGLVRLALHWNIDKVIRVRIQKSRKRCISVIHIIDWSKMLIARFSQAQSTISPVMGPFHSGMMRIKVRACTDPWWHRASQADLLGIEMFNRVCVVSADLSHLCRPADLQYYNGKTFWKLKYELEIMFGLTELRARVKWTEGVSLFVHRLSVLVFHFRLPQGETR